LFWRGFGLEAGVASIGVLVWAAVLLAAAMSGAWAIQRATRNAGWVDCVWSAATGLVGAGAALITVPGAAGPDARQILAACMAAAWGLRLAWHIGRRTAGAPEDARYAQFRHDWGTHFESRLYWFLMIQAAASWVLVLTVLLAARNPAPALAAQDWLGAAVFAVAICGEAVADAQMQRFRAACRADGKHGAICERGLWAWSRHPNYFFEFAGWCAYPVLAFNLHTYGVGLASLAGPAMMFWLLRFVSGVPPLEAAMLARRGAAFADYQARVNAFFPWLPRRA
jgi:steroid 5-alpha reductase family enzyme